MGDAEENVPQAQGRRGRRVAVSDRSYTPEDHANRALKKVPKSKDAEKRINGILANNFLFQHLTDEGRQELVDVVTEKKFKAGEVIIKQGDEGDFYYICDVGTCDIFVNDTKVMTVEDGGSFGELALMYNAPRAATVMAVADCTLWAVDRDTFKYTLMNHAIKKRDMYEAFLSDVPLLSTLLPYERMTIADALKPETFPKKTNVITQGETGDKFYILEKGVVKIYKDGKEMGTIESGGYFGELALLTDQPRAATITVSSDEAIILAIDKKTFTGVMGPVHLLLKRNATGYEQYLNEDFDRLQIGDDVGNLEQDDDEDEDE